MTNKGIKFIILTATYKRSNLLQRTIESVLKQTYKNWEMYILNDSPDDSSYDNAEINNLLENKQIHYFKNDRNYGKNYSLNKLLDKINIAENPNSFVLFLDDDDWLNDKTLEKDAQMISGNPSYRWFVSNHITKDGKNKTISLKGDLSDYSYAWDYLISKKLAGDATHIIKLESAKEASFSNKIKNGEEWFYFSQIRPNNFLYYDFDSKLSDDYKTDGLSSKNTKILMLKNTFILFFESLKSIKISPILNLSILVYFCGRLTKTLIKTFCK